MLAACNVDAAARLLRVSWDEAWHLMDRAVARGRAAKPLAVPAHVGVDEKAAGKGHDYITVVCDLDAGTVDYIADERRQASLDGYFDRFTPEQLEQIEAVAMDMWEPYAASVRAHLSDAEDKIVFDRYHLMGYLAEAVDTVRKAENRALAAAGDKSLAGSKYLWLYSAGNLPARHSDRFATLRSGDLKTARAWAIKESLRHLWSYKRRGWAAKHFKRWYFWATHSPAETDHRSRQDVEAPRGGAAVLLRPPDHQRRRRRPELTHPGHPGLCARLPQPRAFQDRDLLPPRRAPALPRHPMTHPDSFPNRIS